MTTREKREVYDQVRAITEARRSLGTVAGLARKYGLTRQRIQQIVKEVELSLDPAAQGEPTHEHKKDTDHKGTVRKGARAS